MARTPIKFQAGPRDLLNDVADVVPVHGYEARRLFSGETVNAQVLHAGVVKSRVAFLRIRRISIEDPAYLIPPFLLRVAVSVVRLINITRLSLNTSAGTRSQV